jgi:phage shock protein A
MAKSRPKRWEEACASAREALGAVRSQWELAEGALQDLDSIRQEYEEWRDNLPENLQDTPLGEKLNEVCELDLEMDTSTSLDEMEEKLDTAEAIDLPRGFGRD